MEARVRAWPVRRWVAAAVGAGGTVVFVGVPTALIPTSIFGRGVPAPGWAWPVLPATAVLSGLVMATYVALPGARSGSVPTSTTREGLVGGLLAYLAVGCPTCNKLALLALGSTGAVRWLAPVQPILAAVASERWPTPSSAGS
jgi:hypothetical protein